jgi:cell division protein FtsZ
MEIYPIPDKSNINTAAKICVIGIGTCGGNQVRDLIKRGISGVSYVIANTDVHSLSQILEVDNTITSIVLGKELTKGLGAGSDPQIGRAAAEECTEEIQQIIAGYDIVFICAGMGGGTGTGAAPYIAELAKEQSSLTISIIAKCRTVEGNKKTARAEEGIKQLLANSDTVIVIPNDKLKELYAGVNSGDAYRNSNEPLVNALNGIVKIIHNEADHRADLNDIKNTLKGVGNGIIGIGTGVGENAHLDALNKALNSPLLDNYKIKDKSEVLLHLEYGDEYGIECEDEIMMKVQNSVEEGVEFKVAITRTAGKKEFDVTIVAPAIIMENNTKQQSNANNPILLPEEKVISPKREKLIASEVEKVNIKTNRTTVSNRNNFNSLFGMNNDNFATNIDNEDDPFSVITNSRYDDLPEEQQKEILDVPTTLRQDAGSFENILKEDIPVNEDMPQIHTFVTEASRPFNNTTNRSPFIFEMNKQ